MTDTIEAVANAIRDFDDPGAELAAQYAQAAATISALLAENEQLTTRLERQPPFDSDELDGIACRNDTIKLLDERIAKLVAENARAKAVDTGIGIEPHEQALGWHLPTMLRWIDKNRTAMTMPSGELVGTILRTAADRIEGMPSLNQLERAKEEGVRAGIEAAAVAVEGEHLDDPATADDDAYDAALIHAAEAIRALDPAAIAAILGGE